MNTNENNSNSNNNAPMIVLEEDEYLSHLEHIIRRDFFPNREQIQNQLRLSQQQLQQKQQQQENKDHPIVSIVKYENDDNMDDYGVESDQSPYQRSKDLSLDQFCERYTSEDNASFSELMKEKTRMQQERLRRLNMSKKQLRDTMDDKTTDAASISSSQDEYEYDFVQGTFPVKRKRKASSKNLSSNAITASIPEAPNRLKLEKMTLRSLHSQAQLNKKDDDDDSRDDKGDVMAKRKNRLTTTSFSKINHESSRFRIPETPKRELLLMKATNKISKQSKMRAAHGSTLSQQQNSAGGSVTPGSMTQRFGALSPAAQNLLLKSSSSSGSSRKEGGIFGRSLYSPSPVMSPSYHTSNKDWKS